MSDFIRLNIKSELEKTEKISKLLAQLVPLEQELEKLGITIELKFKI
jgi:hypothetical protein